MNDSDAALVARIIASGDRGAFDLLVRRHQSPVRNFLRRMTRENAVLADDLAQETFLRLHRSIASFRGQAKFSSWLYRIAYHVFLDSRRGRVTEEPVDEERHLAGPDPADRAGDEVDVERMLGHLPIRQRAIFDLHYRKGMTHDEIATALKLPLGTVKSELSRGLDQLRRLLAIKEIR